MDFDQFYIEENNLNNPKGYLDYLTNNLIIINKFLDYKTNNNLELIDTFERRNIPLLEEIALKLDELITQIDE